MKQTLITLGAALTLCVAGAAHAGQDVDKLNGSIRVDAGQQMGALHTVNGSVRLAAGASADNVRTVNGDVSLGKRASAGSLATVNGSIELDGEARVKGEVRAVNGRIVLDKGADIGGHLSNVNGDIRLAAAHVGGGIETTAGDIDIGADARVEGGIVVNRRHNGWFGNGNGSRPRVVIGPGAVVKGELRFEQPIDLYVSSSATVGTIKGATAKTFSGDRP